MEKFKADTLTAAELKQTTGGYFTGWNAIGNYIWWYNDDGSEEGVYTSYFA